MPDCIEEYLRQIKDNPDISQWDTLYTHLDAKEPLLMSLRLQDERGGRDERDVGYVVAQEKRLIISGASGMGKTTTLKWLTLVYAEKCLEGAERLIPLYVDLARFKRGMFYDHVLMNAHENGLEEEDFKELLDDGKLAIFLDGLDLLGGSEDFEPVAEIQNFVSEFSRCKFVLSSRPGFFEGFKSGCKVSELVELNDPKIKGYIHKYLGDGDKADTLISHIFDSRNERLKLLCGNPLMLHLVIDLQRDGKIADDRAGIYRESIEGIITHYHEKGKTLASNEQLVRDVLKELAFSMQKENTVRLDYGGVLDVAGSCTSPERYRRISAEQVLEDCFRLGFLHKDGDEVRFGFHQSFQEYFAAVKLKKIFEHGYGISESFSHPKWEDTLIFLSEITERPDELFDDVIDADEIFLAAKLTLHVDDRRAENLCALLLDKVDSESDLEVRMAVGSFAHIGDRATDALMELCTHEEGAMMAPAVAEALEKIGDERAVEPLINALHNDDPEVQMNAAWAIRTSRDERAVEPLISALHDINQGVRWYAALALGSVGDERAVEPLIGALHADDPYVRCRAISSLGSIGDERAVESLIDALHNNDSEVQVRVEIVRALGSIGGEKVVELLADALCDNEPKVRWEATCALGGIEKERAVELLIDALHDADPKVRWYALWRFWLSGFEMTVELLTDALYDDEPMVRQYAILALGMIRNDRAIELLTDIVHDGDSMMQWYVALALGEVGVVEPLIDALHHHDPVVRWYAIDVLEEIVDGRAVEPLIDVLNGDDQMARFMAINALGAIGDGRAVEPLIDVLHDNNPDVRGAAEWALGQIGPKGAVELLIGVLYDEDPDVREGATFDLKNICEPVHREKLKPLLKSDDKYIANAASEIMHSIELKEQGKIKIFKELKKKPAPVKTKSGYTTPSGVKDAEEMLTDAHLGALIDRLKLVPDSITIVDYGCGKGAFLGRMKEIERELGKIHYIGVDISRGNRYLAGITAKRCGVADKLKSCDFMNPDEFFRKDVDIDHIFFSHVLHEIPLKDLPEILYYLLSKMKAGSRITILEQVILVEPERDFVTWDDADFDMLFSGFAEVSSRPYSTGRGHELISVDLERLDTDVDLESMCERCLEVYGHMKERVLEKLRSPDLSDEEHRDQTALLANIDSQIIEYQKSIGLDE
jgi:HEAT repeat protein